MKIRQSDPNDVVAVSRENTVISLPSVSFNKEPYMINIVIYSMPEQLGLRP